MCTTAAKQVDSIGSRRGFEVAPGTPANGPRCGLGPAAVKVASTGRTGPTPSLGQRLARLSGQHFHRKPELRSSGNLCCSTAGTLAWESEPYMAGPVQRAPAKEHWAFRGVDGDVGDIRLSGFDHTYKFLSSKWLPRPPLLGATQQGRIERRQHSAANPARHPPETPATTHRQSAIRHRRFRLKTPRGQREAPGSRQQNIAWCAGSQAKGITGIKTSDTPGSAFRNHACKR
jgi:hypothetical protein